MFNIYLFYFLLIGLLHLIDMIGTILLLKRVQDKYKDWWKAEVNYHKYFFKKWGLIKGALFSFPISLTFIFIIGSLLLYTDRFIQGIFLGTLYFVAYHNLVSVLYHYFGLAPKEKVVLNETEQEKILCKMWESLQTKT